MEPMRIALRSLIRERGMTDTEVWVAAGVSPGALSRYLNGTRGTVLDDRGARTVRKLARVLDVPPDYFVEYRTWRLHRLARLDAQAVTVAYDAAMEIASLGGASRTSSRPRTSSTMASSARHSGQNLSSGLIFSTLAANSRSSCSPVTVPAPFFLARRPSSCASKSRLSSCADISLSLSLSVAGNWDNVVGRPT